MAVKKTKTRRIGVLATRGTVFSSAFVNEIQKILPESFVFQQPAPLLVPLIENSGIKWIDPVIDEYLSNLLLAKIDTLILGCTHFPLLKDKIREKVGPKIEVISQDEIIPEGLKNYLARHKNFESELTQGGARTYEVTDSSEHTVSLARLLCGNGITITEVNF